MLCRLTGAAKLASNKMGLAGFVLMAGLLLQCSNEQTGDHPKESAGKDTSTCTKPLNPNGDSELALLMRKMLDSAQTLKIMVAQGKLTGGFPEEFRKIHTAKPTDAETKKASYDGFASAYLSGLEALYASPKEELKAKYNAVVSACIGCHNEHCPGPLQAIKKLKLD